MSPKSSKKLIVDLIYKAQRVYTALPFRNAPGCALRSAAAKRTRIIAATAISAWLTLFPLIQPRVQAQKRVPSGHRVAVVVDERLSALRSAPDLTAKLIQRLGRGRLVYIRGEKVTTDGLKFYRVALSKKVLGWLQSDALVVPWRAGDDARLVKLLQTSDEFDLIIRARTFLDVFPQSLLRPKVLAMYANAAEDVADKLTRDAGRRFAKSELPPDGAPEFSYYLNFNRLDRYNREGVTFQFDRTTKKFSYDGAAWREILKRYPNSPEAVEARKRLEALTQPAPK